MGSWRRLRWLARGRYGGRRGLHRQGPPLEGAALEEATDPAASTQGQAPGRQVPRACAALCVLALAVVPLAHHAGRAAAVRLVAGVAGAPRPWGGGTEELRAFDHLALGSAPASAPARKLADGSSQESCAENGRWKNLPWVYLTYAERQAWGELGFSQEWWDYVWGAAGAGVRTESGQCFTPYVIGETGTDTCLRGELVETMEECELASAAYEEEYPSMLSPLQSPVDDTDGTPGCHIQDGVGFLFNQARRTGRNRGYTPVCKFNITVDGDCPRRTSTTKPPLMGISLADAVPEALKTCYQELSRDQQDAVRLLRYDIDSWHSCMDPSWNPPVCRWPADVPEPGASCLAQQDYLHGKYNISEPWSRLTFRQRLALTDLGWDADGLLWEARDFPESYAKEFSGPPPPAGLSKTEREAAEFLGYTPDTWHRCQSTGSDNGGAECLDRLGRLEKTFVSWGSWRRMPIGIQRRLGQVGWTEQLWVDGEPPALYMSKWVDLRHNERVAAKLLGYTEDMWEGCKSSACGTRWDYVINKYLGKQWGDMKLAQQNGWTMLEHSQALWNTGGMMRTRMFTMRWDELTPSQQRQAAFLGHDKGTWQGCNYNWGEGETQVVEPEDVGGPLRTVRGRLVIETPYSAISGNIYGKQVATLPISFIDVIERSIARALFCGNPEYKNYTNGARGPDGEPLCKLPEEFERQRRRIRVITVQSGSIIVDFIIVKNQTVDEMSSVFLFEGLSTQLDSFASPICQDIEFGRFARVAKVHEVPLSNLDPGARERAIVFEQMRGAYTDENGCELTADKRDGARPCARISLSRRPAAPATAAWWLAAVLLATAGAAVGGP